MKVLSTRTFIIIAIVLILAKLFVCSFLFEYDAKDRLIYSSAQSKFTHHFYYGGDDFETVNSAVYYRTTGKILTDFPLHSFIKPRFRSQEPYLTAFRPKAFVFTHVFLIGVYERCTGNKLDKPDSIYLKDYLNYYGALLYLITAIVFSFSVYYFYKTLEVLQISKVVCQLGTLAYILIPSIFIFIGCFDNWENISLCSQVILFYFVMADWKGVRRRPAASIVGALMVLSALFRPHLLLSYLALFGFIILVFILRKISKKQAAVSIGNIRTALIGIVLLVLVHVPIFIQNHNYFGKYFLSTQSEFEFFQGHNPFARSSWNSGIYIQNKPYFDSIFASKNIVALNEYEEGKLYSGIAKDWMLQNPRKEIMLDIKKVAGYFLPYNHLDNELNVYTLLLELAFFVFGIIFVFKFFSKHNKENMVADFLIMLPALMTILLTVLFFVGYRWRYYGEPFFLIMLATLLDRYWVRKKLGN